MIHYMGNIPIILVSSTSWSFTLQVIKSYGGKDNNVWAFGDTGQRGGVERGQGGASDHDGNMNVGSNHVCWIGHIARRWDPSG